MHYTCQESNDSAAVGLESLCPSWSNTIITVSIDAKKEMTFCIYRVEMWFLNFTQPGFIWGLYETQKLHVILQHIFKTVTSNELKIKCVRHTLVGFTAFVLYGTKRFRSTF